MRPHRDRRVHRRLAIARQRHIAELAELETLDQGKPVWVGRYAEIPGAIGQFRYFAGQAMRIEGTTIDAPSQRSSMAACSERFPMSSGRPASRSTTCSIASW